MGRLGQDGLLEQVLLCDSSCGEQDGYQGFKKICESGERPEFVFAATFPLALGLYRAAGELGLRIPDDIDIIRFGNSGMNQALSPPMTYIEQPTNDLGRKALDLTLEHIRYGSQFVPRLITLPTKLILARTAIKHPHSGARPARHSRQPLSDTEA